MKNNTKYMLLEILSIGGNLYSLVAHGYSHAQVSILVEHLISHDYMTLNDGSLALSEKGQHYLDKSREQKYLFDTKQWIRPQQMYHEEAIDPSEIVFPKNSGFLQTTSEHIRKDI